MNALLEIQTESKVIVKQLAQRQIDGMKARFNEYQEWMGIEGNAVLDKYSRSNEIDGYSSTAKYVYMTQYTTYNHESNKLELPTQYPGSGPDRSWVFRNNKYLCIAVEELRMQRGKWEDNYRQEFIGRNTIKLNRALSKFITNEMSASNIKIRVGGDGAEVTANVDGKYFRTFGILCGGGIQCLHYRYRNSLK